MLITVLGTTTGFGYWGFSLLGHVMDVIYHGHRRIHCLDLNELRAGWNGDKDKPVLVTSDRPDTALSYLLITSGYPILAFFDDPADALVYAAVVDGRPLPDAIRFCSQYFCSLVGCAGSEHVRFFGNGQSHMKLSPFVEAVVAAIGIQPDAEVTAEITARVLAEEGLDADATLQDIFLRRLNGETLPGLLRQRYGAAEKALVHWFVANYGPMLAGRERETMEWPRELFGMDQRARVGEWDVDLIGAPRHIVWGPYLHLPVGGWRARIQFETVENVSGNEIEVDICLASARVARGSVKLPMQGYFEITLDFAVTNPNAPIEIHVGLLKGAIEGRFGLRRVTMEPAEIDEAVAGQAAQRVKTLQDSLP